MNTSKLNKINHYRKTKHARKTKHLKKKNQAGMIERTIERTIELHPDSIRISSANKNSQSQNVIHLPQTAIKKYAPETSQLSIPKSHLESKKKENDKKAEIVEHLQFIKALVGDKLYNKLIGNKKPEEWFVAPIAKKPIFDKLLQHIKEKLKTMDLNNKPNLGDLREHCLNQSNFMSFENLFLRSQGLFADDAKKKMISELNELKVTNSKQFAEKFDALYVSQYKKIPKK